MFWRFGIAASSIDNLLQQPETEGLLELLLEEEDLLHECKARNQKLLEFLAKPEIIARMLSYVTGFPIVVDLHPQIPTVVDMTEQPAVSVQQNHTTERIIIDVGVPAWEKTEGDKEKYPFLCSELISSDESILTDFILDNDNLLKQLWAFVSPHAWPVQDGKVTVDAHHAHSQEWDNLRCSYWSKVCTSLLATRKGEQVLVSLLSLDNTDALDGLLHRLDNSSFSDLLLRIVGCEVGETEVALELDAWFRKGCLIPRLLEMMHPRFDSDTHVTAAQTLLDIIAVSYQAVNPSGEPHAQALLQIHHHNQLQKEEHEREMQSLREERLAMIGVGPRADDELDIAKHLASYEALPPPVPPITIFGGGPLMTELKSEASIEQLVASMLLPELSSASSLTNGINIIIELIRRYCSDIESAEMTHHQYTMTSSLDTESNDRPHPITDQQIRALAVDLDGLLRVIGKYVEAWTVRLGKVSSNGLGAERLRICELLAEVLHLQYLFASSPLFEVMVGGGFESAANVATVADDLVKVTMAIVETQALVTCLDLFFEFPWNNFLHSVVYDMIAKVSNTYAYASSACMESTDGPFLKTEVGREKMVMIRDALLKLVLAILKDGQLTERILKAQRLNDYEEQQPRGVRLGYMGHLTHVSDECCKLWEKCADELRDEVGVFFDAPGWLDYSDRVLQETKLRDQAPLGGSRPSQGGVLLGVLGTFICTRG
jgi:hypothetical protein